MANSKLLIEDDDQEYEISQDDIDAYAKQIGIDVKKEPHLTWIAKEGLSAKVPEPWLICSDEKDRVFYYNPKTSETSWRHPLDKHYAVLVAEERSKSKSLNSASSDYGFESKLSSLADAPPLSSSGKNSPSPFKSGKKDGNLSAKRFEFGHIENRRGTQLAPVRLNTLKMPTASVPKSGGGMSFMPKGTSFTKNIKRVKEEQYPSSQLEEGLDYEHDDSNESMNSDDGSKYSYEAVDINSLVQLQTNVPPRLDSSLKRENIENIYNKDISSSLSLRKVNQPNFLKPLAPTTKKKGANKSSKATKKVNNKNLVEVDTSLDDKISVINDQQQLMFNEIQKEWLAMQDEIEKTEKEKYEEILTKSTRNLQEEEIKLRQENSEKIEKIKSDLQKKIEEEERAAEMSLQSFKESNKQKISEEEKKLQEELEILSESLKTEIKKLEEKNALELVQRKKELEESASEELANLRKVLECNKKSLEEAHEAEISNIQKAHEEQIKEIKNAHEKEICETNSSVSQKEGALEEIEKLQKLIKEESEKYQNLLKEKENMHNEICSEKKSLEELKNEASKAQSTVEELQDEIEKTENDLDLLRSEKSGLISELNVIKENISNQKANLSNLEKKSKVSSNCSKNLSEIGVNTDLSYNDFISKSVQASVSCCDISSQVENDSRLMSDAMCQTSVIHETESKSSQTVPVPSFNKENIEKTNNDKKNLEYGALLDRNIENAFSGLSTKIDSRINVIENQLRLLQENLSNPVPQQSMDSSQEFMQNQYSKPKTTSNTENRNLPPAYFTNNSLSVGHFSRDVHMINQNKCKCEIGDPESCSVLQDVKNSVYRLNDILCAGFVPPLRNNAVFQANELANNYSSPFENFYAQLRQMQEKQRMVDLKQKCEDSTTQFAKDSPSHFKAAKNLSKINERKSSYHLLHSGIYSHTASEDPLIRARSVVLREKARAWKEQQALQSSVSHVFSMNSSSENLHSSNSGFMLPCTVPSSEQTLFNFEVDPETDFNMWMTRLNALQLRIRSHKIL